MRRLVISTLFLYILVGPAGPARCAPAGPKIGLSLHDWNFGQVYQWTDPQTDVVITNTGDQDLLIKDVKASCGCTVLALSDKTVRPGGTALLKINLVTESFIGRIRKQVVVYSNDPAAAAATINIQGYIKADRGSWGFLEPDGLDLGVVAPFETRYFFINIRNRGNIDLPVRGISLPPGYFLDVSPPDAIRPGGQVSVKLGYRQASKGAVNDTLKVTLGNPQKELAFRVAGYVSELSTGMDSLVITPTAIRVSPGSKARSFEVGVKNDGRGRVLVEGAEGSVDGSSAVVDAQELAPGQAGKITLTLNPDALKADTKGYLYIRVALPVELDKK